MEESVDLDLHVLRRAVCQCPVTVRSDETVVGAGDDHVI